MSDIDALFQRQRAHRAVVKRSTARERKAKLRRLRDAIVAARTDIERALHADFRKPAFEVDFTEIVSVLEEIDFAIRHVGKWMKPRHALTPFDLFGTRSMIWPEPRGVVLIIGPWNYPFALVMSPLVAAISAGNCAIVKPSELTPATTDLVARVLRGVFPEEEVAVVQGGVDAARSLLALPFDHVFFTGSIPVGKVVMEAAAKTLASVTLELGGKSPAIIDESANVPLAARRVLWAKFINAGQTCVAPDYVWVHESRAVAFRHAALDVLREFYGADEVSRRASPDLSRIINARNFVRLKAAHDGSVAMGAAVDAGGVFDESERYIAPTILSGVTWDMPIMRDEIFGPILPVLTYRRIEDVFDELSNMYKPLALYVFSGTKQRALDIVRNTSAGGTVVNNAVIHAGNSHLPFGGVGASGIGNYHGEFGFRTFSHERAVLVQGPWRLLDTTYPPYGKAKEGLIRAAIKVFSRM
ncbi:MAG TPA: aldehyde dehydrogenase family protein [Gemmatimonadaceae bacterium]|nr:aldehyde dehydrogenase family protein [Gemmatimonadaceae bacterium]